MNIHPEDLYSGWTTGRLDALWFVLANRGFAPHAAFSGEVLNLSPRQPQGFEVPAHKVQLFFQACGEGTADWMRATKVEFSDLRVSNEGLRAAEARMVDMEYELRRRDSNNQFYLCLARRLGIEVRSARYARREP